MKPEPGMSEDDVRRTLSILDGETPPVPQEFADRLWADLAADPADPALRIESDSAGDVAGSVLRNEAHLDVRDVGVGHEIRDGRSARQWALAAAAGLVVVAGLGVWTASRNSESPTDIAADGAIDRADEAQEETGGSQADEPVALDFASAAELTDVGVRSARVNFTSTVATAYNVSLRTDGRVVSTSSGTVVGNERIEVSLDSLEPATSYLVDVTLIGPPTKQSDLFAFRTLADPNDPASFDDAIEILQIEQGVGADGGVLNVETSVCAQASFAVLDSTNQAELGRVQATGDCSTTHRFDLGDIEADLGTRTSFLVIVEVEQVVDLVPNGNVTTRSVVLDRG